MTENQLKYADFCISILNNSYPESNSLTQWMDGKKIDESQKIINILESEGWIEKDQGWYKLTKSSLSILQKHNSYSNYYKFKTKKEERKERKEIIDFHIAKWKYYTFWWFFGLAIFGGGYSVYDIIERLSTPKSNKKTEISTTTLEEFQQGQQGLQNTLILNHENLDSLHSSKTCVDSLIID